ncbi:polyphosphate polymerase domain-containing protein [Vallitalea okinawensis]|uniref:polyphosphate polymerase domain-containing protein n=1 Tax=Vallitalea okinawensis TaxID=2078660 RepID=UPI000CFCDD5D|nr:polyphosphate polymerase domain-containing protein [Vallitalea okinawensis]
MLINRKELKYVISDSDYYSLSNVLKKLLIQDPNNGEFGYKVRSLYFDSLNNIDYYSKIRGEEDRKKIRLRIYDTDCLKAKLEIKRKINFNQIKETVEISKDDAKRLIKKDYQVLLSYDDHVASTAYNIMSLGQYQPVVLVEYDRRAYIHTENNIRITLDSDIRTSETNFQLFSDSVCLIPMFNHYHALLEVKYNGELFGWISQILGNRESVNQSFSKYCSSRKFYDNYIS